MKHKQVLIIIAILLFGAWITDATAKPPPPHHSHKHKGQKRLPEFLEHLPEAEKQRFQKLYKEDPAAFHAEIRKYWKNEFEKQKQEVMAIAKRYHEAKDEATRQQIKQELSNKITLGYDKHLAFAEKNIKSYEKRIQQMQKRLEHLKKQTEAKKQNKEANVDKMVDWVLKEADPAAKKN